MHFASRLLAVSALLLAACPRALPATAPVAEAPTEGLPAEVQARVDARWKQAPDDYVPRTKHLNSAGKPLFTNRLFLETSPYLRQHAHNPVNWFPWGDEAFARAKALGRPVFLSVGYSTCHWCHVMEEESFEDLEVAGFLNENYVAIKVDREERPDIDAIYMDAVRLLTRGGGWPMSVWLTPDRDPFMGGTYFPARDGDRGTRKGFLTLLTELKTEYTSSPDEVVARAKKLAARVRADLAAPRPASEGPPPAPALDSAFDFYASMFDADQGGLKRQRKFPSSLPLRVLLRHHRRTGDKTALAMATRTLDRMADGGIHDHVGGGFHRYTVDPVWLVPHFEKMLYDNALLAVAYLEGFQLAKNPRYRDVARKTLDYVAGEMTAPGGAFYSATDADMPVAHGSSHREEGLFFTWTPAEIDALLEPDVADVVKRHYGVTARGNFEGRNVLHVAAPLQSDDERASVAAARPILYGARAKRPPPLRDEKILASWNGLMISAFATSARITGDEADLQRARRAADFVLTNLRGKDGRLSRSFKDGHTLEVTHKGSVTALAFLDDYAFMTAALLDLFEASGEARWLDEAMALDAVLAREYEDTSGGFFRTPTGAAGLLVREKPASDGAVPSGNSVHARTLLRLAALTADDDYRKRAARLFAAFGSILSRRSTQLSEMLLALDFDLERDRQIVLVAPEGRAGLDALNAATRGVFVPNAVIVRPAASGPRPSLRVLEEKLPLRGTATAYVCEELVCRLPVTAPDALVKQLRPTLYPDPEATQGD